MFIKSQVELIYEGHSVSDNGDPIRLDISKVVRCDEMETFSHQYYNEQQRNMRISRNLVIPTYLCEDIIQDNIRFELMYCNYNGLKYKVKNVLKYKSRTVKNTRMKMVLDIEELK